jgi:putative endonuclease
MDHQNRDRIRLGRDGENAAVRYLEQKKFRVIVRGYRWHRGEIDVIAWDGETLVFAEVKTRADDDFGVPEASVTPAKRRQIRRVALAYLVENRLESVPCRFDVLAVEFDGSGRPVVRHLPNAF